MHRRTLARRAGTLAAGALAFGLPAWAGAAPTRGSGRVVLVWAPWSSVPFSSTLVRLYREAVAPFLASHPGIDVVFSPAFGNGSQLVANVLAGQAPDLSSQYQWGIIHEGGAALDLTPFVREYNLDLSLFSKGRIDHWRTATGLYGIPSYTNVYGTIINLGVLDELGLAYPPPDWTYEDALRLWRAATRTGAKAITGGKVMSSNLGGNLPSAFYLRDFGAHYHDPADNSVCTLDTPEAIAAGEFWYGAILEGIASTYGDGSCFPWGIHDNKVVVDTFGTCDMPDIASKLSGFKWDLWVMPSFPAGRYTVAGPDSYVIAANTRHPRETWELLYWFAVNPWWQRWQMRTLLGGPVLNSLWPEYTGVLQQVAPPLRGKNLAVIGESSPNITLRGTFAYDNTGANSILNKWGGLILQKKVSVAEGFREAARQVNAFEREARLGTAALEKQLGAVQTLLGEAARTPQPIVFPAPATAGPGMPVKAAAAGALQVRGGVYTLTGTGAGISGTDDGCTFVALPWRLSRLTLTCRVVSIASPGGAPATGAKMGLMARGALSSSAATIALEVAIDRGIHLNARPLPTVLEGDQQPAPGNGLLPASALLVPSSQSAANYLLRPIWLRLDRDGAKWTAYTSTDGHSWTQGGNTVGVEMAGVWIGIFATPHAEPGKIRVVFDHLSIHPTAAYQIGG